MKDYKSGKYIYVVLHIILLMVLVLVFMVSGCKHKFEKENFIGPEYASAPKGFNVVGNSFIASPDPIDFTIKQDTFYAVLSHRVSWTIKITGQGSKAEKIIKGLSDKINSSNASWDGGSDNIMFFRQGEICDVELSFLGSDIVLTDNITIFKTKLYSGILISDFDGGGIVPNTSSWYSYSDTASGVLEISSYGFLNTILPSVQGTKSLHMKGKDLDNDWYIGGCGYWEDKGLDVKLSALSTNPDEIYLNAFINSNGNTTTGVSFSVFEATGPSRDVFYKNVPVDWTGWKLISYKLSGFSKNPVSVGNGVVDVNTLKTMEFVPYPTMIGATCDMNIDYVIFTVGDPFKP
jgi:hypothetical protein